ncbi:undecaprenyl phosphate translocase family protein [Alienimonas sp. DA493]|uniref:undecaprenyl phosphate translocase family protein n=1 Tax=Alienimonas sp. DA493 TaxID=3373605 RepID=UPI003754B4AC
MAAAPEAPRDSDPPPDPPLVSDEQLERDFDAAPPLREPGSAPVGRTVLAGGLMGTANLVPGVSGGTMVLVCGLYAHFVDAMATVSQGRLIGSAGRFLALLFAAKFAAMGLLGGPVAEAVDSHQAHAYALFIGMTLAGTPVVWDIFREAPAGPEPKAADWLLIPIGAALMASLALLPPPEQHARAGRDYRPPHDIPMDAAAGAAAFGAMALPGVSGGTVKLAMGRYEPTVWSLGQPLPWLGSLLGWNEAAPVSAWGPILLPYALGAIVGLVAVSNLLKWLLQRYERAMAALLLGVLWGSVVPVIRVGWFGGASPLPDAGSGDWFAWAVACVVGFAAVYALTVWQKRAERRAHAQAAQRAD